MSVCPHCKENIKEGASKCPHCQSDLRNWFRRHPILTLLLIIIIGFVALTSYLTQSHIDTSDTSAESDVSTLPVLELADKTEENIKADYASIYTNYSEGHITPSGKVRITGFDIPNANIQIDYDVRTNTPIYVGYSYSRSPLPEDTAWTLTGVGKPTSTPVTNPGIMNRRVYVWQNESEFSPFVMLTVSYEADGAVGGIYFSKEDLQTAQGSSSLYYVE